MKTTVVPWDRLPKGKGLVRSRAERTLRAETSVAITSNPEPNNDVTKINKSFGFYLVGSEIAVGIWRNGGNSDRCYWAITDRKGEIIENFIGMTGGTMVIPETAFQVQLEKECGTWEYLGK